MFPLTTATKSHKLRGFKGQPAPRQPGKRYHPASPPRFPGPNYPCPLLHTLQTGTKSGGPHDDESESPESSLTAGALRSLLSRASTSTGVSRPFCSLPVHPPGHPLGRLESHICFAPSAVLSPAAPSPPSAPSTPAAIALVRPLLRARSPEMPPFSGPPAPGRGCSDQGSVAGEQFGGMPAPGAHRLNPISRIGASRLHPTRQPARQTALGCRVWACGGANPAAQAAAFQLSGHAPLPRRPRPPIGAWARRGRSLDNSRSRSSREM